MKEFKTGPFLMNKRYSSGKTEQKKLSDYSGRYPSEDCYVLGCNTFGCLSSGKCEG